jgi:hypothetical protein
MEEKLWYEFVHTKYGDCYLCHYLSAQQDLRKLVKIFTLLFSTTGILGWTVWKDAPIVSCILVAIVQLFHLVENQVILSESDILKIAELRTLYLKQCNKIEKLWVDYRANRVTEKEVSDSFFKLREEAIKIEALDNKLNIKQRKKLMEKADRETKNYINQFHS